MVSQKNRNTWLKDWTVASVNLLRVLLHRQVSISAQSWSCEGNSSTKVGTFNWMGDVTVKGCPVVQGGCLKLFASVCLGFPEAVSLGLPVLDEHEENS